jgi:hypothetical protein
MMTVRHIEKLWTARDYNRLLQEMLTGRPEASLRLEADLTGPVSAAAVALLRLDELAQAHVPLYAKLLKTLIAAQDSDGGWSDPLTAALCLRALFAGRGHGLAIDRGLAYLANLQKPEGIWPKAPIRRLPADAFISAFVMLQLGNDARFRTAVRFDDAIGWFETNQHTLDAESRRLWDHASVRCRAHRREMRREEPILSWS